MPTLEAEEGDEDLAFVGVTPQGVQREGRAAEVLQDQAIGQNPKENYRDCPHLAFKF